LILGAAALNADHRAHHADTDGDPHTVIRGAWYAHVGWLFHRQIMSLRRGTEDSPLATSPFRGET
jgi:fatty-acid desaturase